MPEEVNEIKPQEEVQSFEKSKVVTPIEGLTAGPSEEKMVKDAQVAIAQGKGEEGLEEIANEARVDQEKMAIERYNLYFSERRQQLNETLNAVYETPYGHKTLLPLRLTDELTYDQFASLVPTISPSATAADPMQFFTGDMSEMYIMHSSGTTGKPKEFYSPKKEFVVKLGSGLEKKILDSRDPVFIHGAWDAPDFLALEQGVKAIRGDTRIGTYSEVSGAVGSMEGPDMIFLAADVTSFRMFMHQLDNLLVVDPQLPERLAGKDFFVDLNSEPVTAEQIEMWYKKLKDTYGLNPDFSVNYGQNDTGTLGLYIYKEGDKQEDMRYKINNSRLVEVVDDQGKLVVDKKGDVLVTTFRKDGSILVRYSTGDEGILSLDGDGNAYLSEISRKGDSGMVSLWGEKLFVPDLYYELLKKMDFPLQFEILPISTEDGGHKDLNITLYSNDFNNEGEGKQAEEDINRLILEALQSNAAFKRMVEIGMVNLNISFQKKAPERFHKGWRILPEQRVA